MNEYSPTTTNTWPRIIAVAGAHNLRDMGGYATADGRTVKWRRLFRSGRMNAIKDSAIAQLGVVAICDLRDNRERALNPTQWHAGLDVDYWSRDYAMSMGDLQNLSETAAAPPEAIYASMISVYRELPYEQAPAYRAIFGRLVADKLPLLFNCAAGKDRTGIAAALILSALGVPRETIVEDYTLSDEFLEQLTSLILRDPKYASLASESPAHYLPLLRADPAYLATMFEDIDRRHGSVAGYLDEVLDVGMAEIAALQENLLEGK